MLINFDVDKHQFARMRVDEEKRRWYYALSDPRVVLRLDGFDLESIAPGEWCDGLIGWDAGYEGFVHPQNIGRKHTKVTLRARGVQSFDLNTPPADLKMLSAILAEAPRNPARFDAQSIADDVIARLTEHVSRLSMRLSIGGWLPGVSEERDFCPLRAEIQDLCRVANGEVDRATADGDFVADTYQLLQDIAKLCAWWWTAEYEIPPSWRETPLGRAWTAAWYWLESDDMITLSEAAMLLYGAATDAELHKIDRLIKRGKLAERGDPNEPNPRRARRVLQREVKALQKTARRS